MTVHTRSIRGVEIRDNISVPAFLDLRMDPADLGKIQAEVRDFPVLPDQKGKISDLNIFASVLRYEPPCHRIDLPPGKKDRMHLIRVFFPPGLLLGL